MMEWFRSHHGAPFDPKWQLVARKSGQTRHLVVAVAWALLDCASQAEDRGCVDGFDVEAVAGALDADEAAVDAIVAAMRTLKRPVIADGRLAAWDRRQPKREDATAAERMRRHRAAKKSENGGNQPETEAPEHAVTGVAVTDGHAPLRDVTQRYDRGDRGDREDISLGAPAAPRAAAAPRKRERAGIADLTPDAFVAYAAEHAPGVDVAYQLERFRNWSASKDRRHKNATAAFRNWLLKAGEDLAKARGNAEPARETPAALLARTKRETLVWMVGRYRREGTWQSEAWGDPPGAAGCLVPADVLAECGYGSEAPQKPAGGVLAFPARVVAARSD